MSEQRDVDIRVFGSRAEYASRDQYDEQRIAEIIRSRVLPRSEASYFRVDVKVVRGKDQTPKYLVAYMLRRDIYTAEVVRVDVDADLQPGEVTFEYDESEDEETEDYGTAPSPPGDEAYGYALDFVVGTPVPDIPSAKAGAEAVYNLLSEQGFMCRLLEGANANVANYKAYLAAGLKGFINIGHGNPNCIVVSDGTVSSAWLKGLSGQPLRPEVVYWNSCQVCNDPTKSAMLSAGARTFIGGIVNLLIGPSEEVCKCFWGKVVSSAIRMDDALHQCETAKYPAQGAHGIVGDTGPFAVEKLRLAHAMWIHGHIMQIEYPERLDLERRYGFFVQVRGKPFTGNWFHFAVPTPVIVDGERLRVGSVLLRFRTGPGATIVAVHVYDGEEKISAHDGLQLSPQGGFAMMRFDVPAHPYIKLGLGISIGVKFGDGANLPPNKLLVEISSAGCDFLGKA